jgi:spore coat polysaccharide biosynthesis protein SpsF
MTTRAIGLITVRLSSSRLPQKALLPIGNKPLIEHVIRRAKENLKLGLEKVVICTSTETEDDVFESIAQAQGVDCYRGSLQDKIARWQGAAHHFNADVVVAIDADDPFCDPELIGLALKQLEESGADIVTADREGYVCGGFTHAMKSSVLDEICDLKDTTETEMTKPYLIESGRFKVEPLVVPELFKDSSVRLTLDYPEDLEFFRKLFEEMNIEENTVPLREILQYLQDHPKLKEINFFRQGDFLANQKKSEKLELKK